MTSWQIERDRLVEQTLAFVEGVKGASRTAAKQTVSEQPVAEHLASAPLGLVADALALASSLRQPPTVVARPVFAPRPAPVATQAHEPVVAVSAGEAGPMPFPVRRSAARPLKEGRLTDLTVSERDLIARHVTRFRTRQRTLGAAREAYYVDMRDSMRTALGDDAD